MYTIAKPEEQVHHAEQIMHSAALLQSSLWESCTSAYFLRCEQGLSDIFFFAVFFSLPVGILSDFSDSLLKRYGITEKPQRERVNPSSQITELEQKKPRRKDTPAIHIPPLIIGKRIFTPRSSTEEANRG